MAAKTKETDAHYRSAREKAAGHKASRRWVQDLITRHLLDSEDPIRKEPLPERPART